MDGHNYKEEGMDLDRNNLMFNKSRANCPLFKSNNHLMAYFPAAFFVPNKQRE
jgi:hypothetical protein